MRIARALLDVEDAFRDAARRRRVARERGDIVGLLQAEGAVESAFTRRTELLAERTRLEDAAP